ncbi:substrate-binding domain-containing protein [Acidimangrovimonas sediminis]|uniref:substrate-binding domain-containing protein n=1 Tax=Acidimangrovimonas sediminis TaxID=2056283 RepID=UPI001E31CBBE|nr:substrate-binding domain-containing protein [Acidimangrovimonas sediminis]
MQIGLLIQQTGPAGIWSPSAEACARLAVSEINRQSGILKQHVELVVEDAGRTVADARAAARRVVRSGAQGIVGMLPSYARRAIADSTFNLVPFIYTPQYEGIAPEAQTITTGETAAELLAPGLRWLADHRDARRYFLCGSDYIWPRSSLSLARSMIPRVGGEVVGEAYMPVDADNYDSLIERIKRARPDVVLPYFLGGDGIAFNRAFHEAGLCPHVLRFTSAIDETIVYGLPPEATENLFVSSGYFASVRSHNNGAFLERYHTAYGEAPPPVNSFGQSCYEGIYCLASLVEHAEVFDTRAIHRLAGHTPQLRTARGSRESAVVGGRHPIFLAELDGYDFNMLAT